VCAVQVRCHEDLPEDIASSPLAFGFQEDLNRAGYLVDILRISRAPLTPPNSMGLAARTPPTAEIRASAAQHRYQHVCVFVFATR